MKRIVNSYNSTKCCVCRRSIEQGAEQYYDAAAERGKRSYCIPCGTAKAYETPETPKTVTPHDEAEAELAALKAKLKAMEVKAEPAPSMQTVNADPLAQAIARAVEPLIANKLDEERVRELMRLMVTEYMKPPAATIRVELPTGVTVDMGRQHKQFHQLLLTCTARTPKGDRLNVWIVGPAGTGKTTAAEKVAKALSLRFASTGSLTETYKLFGFMSPGTGTYVRTPFREMWEFGGVFIFDDFDGSDPVAAIELNNALANGYCTFPDGTVKRHEDCVLILTANTWGLGGTNDYVGRVKQDAAFLDRFVQIDWEIDEDLERETCANTEWVTYVQKVRANVKAKGIKALVTPRASYAGTALLATGLHLDTVKAMTLQKAMTAEQWRSVQ